MSNPQDMAITRTMYRGVTILACALAFAAYLPAGSGAARTRQPCQMDPPQVEYDADRFKVVASVDLTDCLSRRAGNAARGSLTISGRPAMTFVLTLTREDAAGVSSQRYKAEPCLVPARRCTASIATTHEPIESATYLFNVTLVQPKGGVAQWASSHRCTSLPAVGAGCE